MNEAVEVLLPCPFCGGTNVVACGSDELATWCVEHFKIADCDAIGPDARTREAAIAAWNRRTVISQQSEQSGGGWIAVSDGLPPSNRPVIAALRNPLDKWRVIRAQYAAPNTLPVDDGAECDGTYDEASGTYYCEAGWYEDNEHEEIHWRVDDPVLFWQPLPAPPASVVAAPPASQPTKHKLRFNADCHGCKLPKSACLQLHRASGVPCCKLCYHAIASVPAEETTEGTAGDFEEWWARLFHAENAKDAAMQAWNAGWCAAMVYVDRPAEGRTCREWDHMPCDPYAEGYAGDVCGNPLPCQVHSEVKR